MLEDEDFWEQEGRGGRRRGLEGMDSFCNCSNIGIVGGGGGGGGGHSTEGRWWQGS